MNDLKEYIEEILHTKVILPNKPRKYELPLHLTQQYKLQAIEVLEIPIVLLQDTGEVELSPAQIKKHVDLAATNIGHEVVYVAETMAPHNRKRLIEAAVPFIVPGNQLYLPFLAADLREYYRASQKLVQKVAPATQLLILYRIYSGEGLTGMKDSLAMLGKRIGYSKMSISRAQREMDAVWKSAFDDCSGSWSLEHWKRITPFLASPIQKLYYTDINEGSMPQKWLSGLSALAQYSALSAPKSTSYAVYKADWLNYNKFHAGTIQEKPDGVLDEIEVWKYDPSVLKDFGTRNCVDPLSLYLILKDTDDERIEMANDELLAGLGW